MRRGEIWWADLSGPVGKRPVVLLSRDESYAVRRLVTVAPVTTRIRNIPVEVPLGPEDGLPRRCVVNLDTITTIDQSILRELITRLTDTKIEKIEEAIIFALGLKPVR